MVTLKQFREMTKDFPEDTPIQIESVFKPENSMFGPAFDIITMKNPPAIVLLPSQVYIDDGMTQLSVKHEGKKAE